MWASIWQLLEIITTGSLLWLAIIFLLAMFGEMGLPATSPFLESLLIFTGFQITHGAYAFAAAPFLAIACAGRLCGSTTLYRLSASSGSKIIDKFGSYVRITEKQLGWVRRKLETFALPAIITARFTPGFTIASTVTCAISQIGYKKFLTAVAIHVLAWEAIFLALGALGGGVAKAFSPQHCPVLLVVWIAIAITVGAALGYSAFRRAKNAEVNSSLESLDKFRGQNPNL